MKKRSLIKRVFSGVVATALAATICFSDRVFNDLFASATNKSALTATVEFFGEDGTTKQTYQQDEADTENYRFFVLGALVSRSDYEASGRKITATAPYEKQLLAWNCMEIDPKTNASIDADFSSVPFYENDLNHDNSDRNDAIVPFDAEKHVFVSRVYRYWGNNPFTPATGIEPTNLIAPDHSYSERSADTVLGYKPNGNTDTENNNTYAKFTKADITYKLDVESDETINFSDEDNYYVLVTVNHKSGDPTYFLKKLIMNGTKQTYTIQDKNTHLWQDKNGKVDEHEQYHGNEPFTTLKLYKGGNDTTITTVLNNTNVTEIKNGAKTKNFEVEILPQSNDGANYTETLRFKKLPEGDNYNYEDILGSGVSFGITADRFALKGHMQTNLAVNYFRDIKDGMGDGQDFESNLSEPSAGEHYIAYFANLTDPTDTSANTSGTITIGDTTRPGVLHVDSSNINRVKLIGGGDKRFGDLNKTTMPAEDIKNNVVDPAIQQMQAMSNLLASKEENITPTFSGSKYVIDSRDYPDDATIYVDADKIVTYNKWADKANKNECNVEFYKKENQTIVMNFKNTKSIFVKEYNVHYEKDGELKNIVSTINEGSEVDEQVMRKIVWNFNSCYNTDAEFKANNAPCVEIQNTAGVFLVPNAKSVTHMTGTSSGWIMTAGYFENTSGEWHFPYHKMKDFEAPKKTTLTVSKQAVTGETELAGATIQVYDKVRGKNIGSTLWDSIIAQAKKDNPEIENSIKSLVYFDYSIGRVVTHGIEWVSGTKPVTLNLRDGSYTLKESGETFTSTDGKTYSVIDSSVDFEITNGKINKHGTYSNRNDDSSISYAENKYTISDAETGAKYLVIDKTDITGKKEIEGATLKIEKLVSEKDHTVDTTFTALSDVSGIKNTWNVPIKENAQNALSEGVYKLTESGGNITDKDGFTYKILTSEVVFKIDAQGNVTKLSDNIVDDFSKVNKKNGGAVLDGSKLTICDAIRTVKVKINKTDITGDKELKNAVLTLTDKDGKSVKDANGNTIQPWTSGATGNIWEVELEQGKTYVLHEDGDSVVTDDEGNEYSVIKSAYEFKVGKDGKITEVEQVEGFKADSTKENVITVRDAKKTVVNINKTDITGNKELANAKLTIYNSNGKEVDSHISSNDPDSVWTVTLDDGTYTLKESASNGQKITFDGSDEYEVLDSTVEFKVENGKIVSSKVINNNGKASDAKTAFDGKADEGYAVVDNNNNKIVICDAQKIFTKVTISKTDITGENELAGAKLNVYKYDGSKTDGKGEQIGKTWTSDGKNKLTLTLEDGTYVLEETGDGETVTLGGEEYEVIDSVLKFTVNDGKIVEAKSEADNIKDKADASSEHGYYIVTDNDIVVSDAKAKKTVTTTEVKINKTDITGEKEIANARLTIYEYDESKNKHEGEEVDHNDSITNKGSEWTVKLPDGKYVLEESAATDDKGNKLNVVDEDGKTYKIINSTVEFEVKDGKVVTTGKKTEFGEAGFVFDKTNHITVCDAANTTVVQISKTDITGEKELTGAKLTLKGSNGVKESWTSKAGQPKKFTLEDGEYTLEETGTEFTDTKTQKTYKVIPSAVKFKVVNGTVTETTKVTVDKASKVNKTNGGVVFDGKNNKFTICDAEAVEEDDDSSSKKDDDSSSKKDDDSSSKKDNDSSSQKDDDSSSKKDNDSSSQKDEDSSSKKDNDSSSQKDEDSSSQKDEDSSSQKDEDSSSQKDEDSSSQKDEDSSSQKDEDSSSQKDEDSSSKKDNDSSSQKDEDSSSQKDNDSSSQKDDDSSSKKDNDSSSQKDEDSSSKKDNDSSSQKDEDSSSQKDDDSSSQKDEDSSSQKDDDSSSKKDDDSSQVTKKTEDTTKATTKATTKSTTKSTTKTTKMTNPSGGDTDGDDDGKKTTTTKSTTTTKATTQPSGGDTDGDDDGKTPQTGHTGSTVAVAGLLAAVAALAVIKKKNDD